MNRVSFLVLCLTAATAVPASAATKRVSSVDYSATDDSSSYDVRTTHHSRHSSASPDWVGFEFGGIVGNANYGEANGQEPQNVSSRTRVMFGGYYEHKLLSWLAVHPELDYTQRGYTQTNGRGQGALINEVAVNFLEVPMLVKGMYPVGIATPYIMTGPYIGLAVGNGLTQTEGDQVQNSGIDNSINSFAFGWHFAVGSTFAIARNVNLEASLRYSVELTNAEANGPAGESISLNAFEFLTGVGFTL